MEFNNVSAIKCENFKYGKESSFTCMLTYNEGTKKNSGKQFEKVDMVRINTDITADNGMYFNKNKISLEFAKGSEVYCYPHESYDNPPLIDIACFKQSSLRSH